MHKKIEIFFKLLKDIAAILKIYIIALARINILSQNNSPTLKVKWTNSKYNIIKYLNLYRMVIIMYRNYNSKKITQD
jgi:hypothetical protein